VDTPDAAPRFQQAPGGTTSICLSGAEDVATEVRGPVGGADTVVLGGDDNKAIFDERQQGRNAPIETPDAAPRFQQGPGGTTSICLSSASKAGAADEETTTVRGPVGGADTVVLGGDNSKEVFEQRQQDRDAAVDTPDAAPRFQQAPGGTTSICLSGGRSEAAAVRGPVGGADTVVLGGDDSREVFEQRQQDRDAALDTPDAAPRFQQAPGGTASICLSSGAGCDGAGEAPTEFRGPVGGADTVVLGGDDSKELFEQRQQGRNAAIETPDAAPRFQQAPGGTASICLSSGSGSNATGDAATTVRGPVGGETTVVLGGDDSEVIIAQRQQERDKAIATPDAAPRFQQAPGGDATISLADTGAQQAQDSEAVSARGPVGGAATIVLGIDDPAEMFGQLAEQRNATTDTPTAAPRFQQVPGGTPTICLGADVAPMSTFSKSECEKFSLESARSTKKVQYAPGGASTICLGSEGSVGTLGQTISANKFANGASQNCGNTITERSTTRLHYAPGGTSTICLGSDKAEGALSRPVSANSFANGASQNCGNTITERSTTRLHYAPGGTSTICLGTTATSGRDVAVEEDDMGNENVDRINLPTEQDGKAPSKPRAALGASIEVFKQPPGGGATVLLG